MSELENPFDFSELEDGGLDINAIFGDSDAAAAPPAPEPVSEAEETEDAASEADSAGQDEDANRKTTAQASSSEDKTDADAESEPDLLAALAPKGETAPKPAQETPRQVSLFDMSCVSPSFPL